jgi:RNA polymerase sigma factor (sigma-70 family)
MSYPSRSPVEAEAAYLANEPLAYHFAGLFGRRWPGAKRRLGSDGLLQCARLGVWRACIYFDPSRGKLSSLAFRCVRGEILDALREVGRPMVSIEATETDVAAPEVEELDTDEIARLRRALDALPNLADAVVIRRRFLDIDTPTLAEVGAEIGVGAERVRQREKRALGALRGLLT